MESEIVRVVSLSTTEISENTRLKTRSTGSRYFNPVPKQALVFTCLHNNSFENTVGKEEIARNEQFLLFPQCFLLVCRTFCHLHQVQNCRLQILSVWKSLEFVVWKKVKSWKSSW